MPDLFLTVYPPVSHYSVFALLVARLCIGFLLAVGCLSRIVFVRSRRLRRKLALSIGSSTSDAMLRRLASLSAGSSQARIGRMVCRFAALAGLDPSDTEHLIAAIPLYDIGMSSVPEAIQRKAEPLDELELGVLHRHPEIGARLLFGNRSASLDFAAELALCHHECWNGKGYPRKLVSDQIPIAARIVAILDSFDRLLSEPLHEPARSLENAVQHIVVEAGRRYDPVLAQLFLDDLPMMLALRNRAGDPGPHDHGAGQPVHRTNAAMAPLAWPAARAEDLLVRRLRVSHGRVPVPTTVDLA